MDDFNSDTDSDYTSYWRDWVGTSLLHSGAPMAFILCDSTGTLMCSPVTTLHMNAGYVQLAPH